jgi:hypothetical protein
MSSEILRVLLSHWTSKTIVSCSLFALSALDAATQKYVSLLSIDSRLPEHTRDDELIGVLNIDSPKEQTRMLFVDVCSKNNADIVFS